MRTSNYTFLYPKNYLYSKPVKVLRGYEEGYGFSFNGQEKDDEISGAGNTMTAEFWEYDTRLVRRWNVDPKTSQYPNISPYSVFNNNPIFYIDPKGLEGENARSRKMAKYDRKAKKLSEKEGLTGEALGDAMEEKYGKKRWMYSSIDNNVKTNAQKSFMSIRDLVDFRDAPRVRMGFQFNPLVQGANDMSLSADGRPLISFDLTGSGAFQINSNISRGSIGIRVSQGAAAFQETTLLANILVTTPNAINIPFNPAAGAFITLRLNLDNAGAGASASGAINYAAAGSLVPVVIPVNVSYPEHVGISKSAWSSQYSLLDTQRRQLREVRDKSRGDSN